MTTTPQEPAPSDEHSEAPVESVDDDRAGDPTAREDTSRPDADDPNDADQPFPNPSA